MALKNYLHDCHALLTFNFPLVDLLESSTLWGKGERVRNMWGQMNHPGQPA